MGVTFLRATRREEFRPLSAQSKPRLKLGKQFKAVLSSSRMRRKLDEPGPLNDDVICAYEKAQIKMQKGKRNANGGPPKQL